jgi:ribosome biogenesis GTPase
VVRRTATADEAVGTDVPLGEGMLQGIVILALSGWFLVQTPRGPLLCRPRGRLRPKGSAWRDTRDAERAEAAMEDTEGDGDVADEQEEAESGPSAAATAGTEAPAGLWGQGRRQQDAPGARPERRGRARGGTVAAPPLLAEHEASGIFAGDRVLCRDLGDGEGSIEGVRPRRNLLTRPPVSNVDRVAAVVSWREPLFSPAFVDRLLLEADRNGCACVLCVNKIDLLAPAERAEAACALEPYRKAGYPVHLISAATGEGIEAVRSALSSSLTVVAGPSGAGKSRLLAALVPSSRPPRSAAVSRRIGRGRHTTRHVELLPLDGGGWVADTPGFSRLDLEGWDPDELEAHYPEFSPHRDACRFRGCRHDREPDCAVRAAVGAGAVDPGRYTRYLDLLQELRRARERRP